MKYIFLLALTCLLTNAYAGSQPGLPTPEDCEPQPGCRQIWSDARKIVYPPSKPVLGRFTMVKNMEWACAKTSKGYEAAGGLAADVKERCRAQGFQYSSVDLIEACQKGSLELMTSKITYTCIY